MLQVKGIKGDWHAKNTIKVKSTIVGKEVVKFSHSKKKFQIKFLDSKGKSFAEQIR